MRRVSVVVLLVAVGVVGSVALVGHAAARAKAPKTSKCPKGKIAARVYRGKLVIGGRKGRVVCVKAPRVPALGTVAERARALASAPLPLPVGATGPSAADAAGLGVLRSEVLDRLGLLVMGPPRHGRARTAQAGEWSQWGTDAAGNESRTRSGIEESQPGVAESDYTQTTESEGFHFPPGGDTSDRYSEARWIADVHFDKCPGSDGNVRGRITITFFDSAFWTGKDKLQRAMEQTTRATFDIVAPVTQSASLARTFRYSGSATVTTRQVRNPSAGPTLEVLVLPVQGTLESKSTATIGFPGASLSRTSQPRGLPPTTYAVVPATAPADLGGHAAILVAHMWLHAKSQLELVEQGWKHRKDCLRINGPSSLQVKKGQRKAFTITVKDSKGRRVGDAHVTAKASHGTITPTQALTNKDGTTHLGYTLKSGTSGTITLTATSNRGLADKTISAMTNGFPRVYTGNNTYDMHKTQVPDSQFQEHVVSPSVAFTLYKTEGGGAYPGVTSVAYYRASASPVQATISGAWEAGTCEVASYSRSFQIDPGYSQLAVFALSDGRYRYSFSGYTNATTANNNWKVPCDHSDAYTTWDFQEGPKGHRLFWGSAGPIVTSLVSKLTDTKQYHDNSTGLYGEDATWTDSWSFTASG